MAVDADVARPDESRDCAYDAMDRTTLCAGMAGGTVWALAVATPDFALYRVGYALFLSVDLATTSNITY